MTYKERNDNGEVFTHHAGEILKLAAEGCMDIEIADEPSISERTVKEIQVNLMRKLDAQDILSVIDYAMGNGLITLYEISECRFSKAKPEVN
jgi:DNA-binding NarL/FixJ family response regulator